MSIISLEGMPGVGKTSSTKKMTKDSFFQNFILYPQTEIDRKSDKELSQLEIAELYLKAEIQKNKNIISKDYNKTIVLDRSYISLIAYQYALAMYKQTNDAIDAYNFLHGAIVENLNDNFIVQPNVIIFLLVDPTVSINRRILYSKSLENAIWFNSVFLNHFHDFYTTLKYRDYYNGKEFIVTSEAEDVKSTFEKIKSIIMAMNIK